MPSYITKNKHDGDPYSWIVGSLDPAKLGTRIPYVKANQMNCNQNLVGKITSIELADLNKSPNFLIHITFADKKLRSHYLYYLNHIINFPLADSNKTDKNFVTFTIPTHRLVEHIIPIFSAMNLIEAIPQNFMMYLSRFLGFNYLEEIEQAIVHELLQGCKEGPMQRPYFERACILAKAANSPEMFAIIATFCARTFLEPYALIAAYDGLELIKNDAMIVQHVAQETIDTLNFRAGIALRACNAETIRQILKESASHNSKMIDSSLLSSDRIQREDINLHAGILSLELDIDEYINQNGQEKAFEGENVLEDARWIEKIESKRLQFALGLLIKITNSDSKYYAEAQEVLSQIFADFSESQVLPIQERLPILGGDRVSSTIMNIAAKMKQTNIKLKEKEKIIASKPESKAVNDILTGYKIQIENLNERMKKMDNILTNSRIEHEKKVSKLQENEMISSERVHALEKEKLEIMKKLDEITRQLFESDEALAIHKAALDKRESRVKPLPKVPLPNLFQQLKMLMNIKAIQLNWKMLPAMTKR